MTTRGSIALHAALPVPVPEDDILQVKGVLYDARGGHAHAQHVLLGGHVTGGGHALQIRQVAVGSKACYTRTPAGNTHTHARRHTRTQTHTHADTHARRHARTHTHTHARTHTHTHTLNNKKISNTRGMDPYAKLIDKVELNQPYTHHLTFNFLSTP